MQLFTLLFKNCVNNYLVEMSHHIKDVFVLLYILFCSFGRCAPYIWTVLFLKALGIIKNTKRQTSYSEVQLASVPSSKVSLTAKETFLLV